MDELRRARDDLLVEIANTLIEMDVLVETNSVGPGFYEARKKFVEILEKERSK